MTTTIQIVEIEKGQLHHARLTKAQKLDKVLYEEYPAMQMSAVRDDETDKVVQFVVIVQNDEGEFATIHEDEQVPELAALLEAADDAGFDPEYDPTEGDDEGPSGSVVDEAYRVKYKEASSTGQSCGDWLAEQLAIDTISGGVFQVADFEAVLSNNYVDQTGAWARLPMSGQKGWVGRWRMNGRQVLEKQIVRTGVYVDTIGTKIEPDAKWLAAMRTKHAKWLAKQERLEAALREDD